MKLTIVILLSVGVCFGSPVESGRSMAMGMMRRESATNKTKALPDPKTIVERALAQKELPVTKNNTASIAVRDTIKPVFIKTNLTEAMRMQRNANLDKTNVSTPTNRTLRGLPKPEVSKLTKNKTRVTKRDTMGMGVKKVDNMRMRMGGMMKREIDNLKISSTISEIRNMTKRDTTGMGMHLMGMMRARQPIMKNRDAVEASQKKEPAELQDSDE